jgi:hypothetical protein
MYHDANRIAPRKQKLALFLFQPRIGQVPIDQPIRRPVAVAPLTRYN